MFYKFLVVGFNEIKIRNKKMSVDEDEDAILFFQFYDEQLDPRKKAKVFEHL
jgi:hypothetical protein